MSDKITITITAQDTMADWFGDYVSEVESSTGMDYTHDDSEYGVFVDPDGRLYEAYVEPSRSDNTSWTVYLEAL